MLCFSQSSILSVPHKLSLTIKIKEAIPCRELLHTQNIHSYFEIKYNSLHLYQEIKHAQHRSMGHVIMPIPWLLGCLEIFWPHKISTRQSEAQSHYRIVIVMSSTGENTLLFKRKQQSRKVNYMNICQAFHRTMVVHT